MPGPEPSAHTGSNSSPGLPLGSTRAKVSRRRQRYLPQVPDGASGRSSGLVDHLAKAGVPARCQGCAANFNGEPHADNYLTNAERHDRACMKYLK